jgi:hypothetical protein
MNTFIYWLPRVLSIVFILFISMFALDVFGEPQWFLALLMHLIPSFILLIMTVVAWNHERLGGIIFIIAGFFMLISSRFESLILSLPAIAIGVLFVSKRFFSKI